MTDSQSNTIDYIKNIIDKKNINVAELSRMTGIQYTALSSIMRKQRTLGEKILLKIANSLNVTYEELRNPPSSFTYKDLTNNTINYVKERESTYSSDSVEIPEFVGENPQVLFLEKLRYLSKIGEMREAGLLDDEEFLKIKSRLIDLL